MRVMREEYVVSVCLGNRLECEGKRKFECCVSRFFFFDVDEVGWKM